MFGKGRFYCNLKKISNTFFEVMGDVQWVNDTSVIRLNPKVTAINSCIEIDLTGQVVSDSIGTRVYSGKIFFSFSKLNDEKINFPLSLFFLFF